MFRPGQLSQLLWFNLFGHSGYVATLLQVVYSIAKVSVF